MEIATDPDVPLLALKFLFLEKLRICLFTSLFLRILLLYEIKANLQHFMQLEF